MAARSIIHLNIADFSVAVERRVDGRLRSRPVIIAPEAAIRAAVYDMSEEAYQDGVRKGMSLKTALRFCPAAVVLPPHPDRYARAMRACFKRVMPYSPLAEMTDRKGHLFLDVSGCGRLFGPPPDIACRIRKVFRAEMGLDPIWSVAANKLVAKVATRLVKPSGELIVREGEEARFLAPLALDLLPGITADDRRQLGDYHFSRIGQVAGLRMEHLDRMFGKRGPVVYNLVRGIDETPVLSASTPEKKIRFSHEFGTDTGRVADIERALYGLTEKIGAQLRRQNVFAKRLGLMLDFSDSGRVIRQALARPPVSDDFSLFPVAALALKRAWTRRVRIRRLTLICDRFGPASRQLELFAEPRIRQAKNRQLMAAVDRIRRRFGPHAVRMGRSVSRTAA